VLPEIHAFPPSSTKAGWGSGMSVCPEALSNAKVCEVLRVQAALKHVLRVEFAGFVLVLASARVDCREVRYWDSILEATPLSRASRWDLFIWDMIVDTRKARPATAIEAMRTCMMPKPDL